MLKPINISNSLLLSWNLFHIDSMMWNLISVESWFHELIPSHSRGNINTDPPLPFNFFSPSCFYCVGTFCAPCGVVIAWTKFDCQSLLQTLWISQDQFIWINCKMYDTMYLWLVYTCHAFLSYKICHQNATLQKEKERSQWDWRWQLCMKNHW